MLRMMPRVGQAAAMAADAARRDKETFAHAQHLNTCERHPMPFWVSKLGLYLFAEMIKKGRRGGNKQIINMHSAKCDERIAADLKEEVLIMIRHGESEILYQESQQSDLPHQGSIGQTIECLQALQDEDRHIRILHNNWAAKQLSHVSPHIARRAEPYRSANRGFSAEIPTGLSNFRKCKSLKDSCRDVKALHD